VSDGVCLLRAMTGVTAKRSRLDIYADILQAVDKREGSKVTRIALASNLPVDRANKVLGLLVSYGLLRMQPQASGGKRYYVADRGLDFLDAYRRLRGFLAALSSTEGEAAGI